MDLSHYKGRLWVFVFTFAYIAAFSGAFLIGGNYEFLVYTTVMLGALFLVASLLRHIQIPNPYLWALSGAGVLHMLGGGVHVHGERLYRHIVWPLFIDPQDPGFVILRYDQIVHGVGYGLCAIAIHFILRRAAPAADRVGIALMSILVATGIGSVNEIAEFVTTRMLPSTGVGDYSNTMLDLIFNISGAIIAVALFELYVSWKKRN